MSYNPKFELNNKIISLVADISKLMGIATALTELDKNPHLSRANRIKTVHDSLAIEQNTLSLEQVTAVLNGKAVIAPPKDIEEVKNAYEIYELLDTLNPYSVDDLQKAHGVMMRGLIAGAGAFRVEPAGVKDARTGEIIHIGTLPKYVPDVMYSLLEWLETDETHPLIKSCVFHYEFEVIHPFLDGNGRTGRLWQTLILSKYEPLFAYLPIESMIYNRQDEYYSAINNCNVVGEATEFIEFMLEAIKETLEEATSQRDIQRDNGVVPLEEQQILDIIKNKPSITQIEIAKILNVSDKTVKRRMKSLQDKGIIERENGKRNGKWVIR